MTAHRTTRPLLAALLLVAALAATLLTTPTANAAGISRDEQRRLTWTVRHFDPCEYEDSRDCVWAASSMGNGAGQSFIDIDGRAHYFKNGRTYRVLARHLPRCAAFAPPCVRHLPNGRRVVFVEGWRHEAWTAVIPARGPVEVRHFKF